MTKIKFTAEDEEKIIHFVKNHEILYNKRHKEFRNTEKKQRLWLEIAEQLDIKAEAVKGKWNTMRDYFMRTKDRKVNGAPVPLTKRAESLMFLTTLRKKSNTKSTTRTAKNTISAKIRNSILPTKIERTVKAQPEETPRTSRKRPCAAAEIRQATTPELVDNKCPTLVEPLQPKPKEDSLHIFFESIAATMRTFPPLSIAKIKLQMSQLVGNEEIALVERDANTKIYYMAQKSMVHENGKTSDSSNESD